MADLYHLYNGGAQSGPYVLDQLTTMWQSGAITADAQYWKEGMAQWDPILSIAGLLNPPPPAPAVPPPLPTPLPPPIPKPMVVAKAKTKTQRVDTEIVPQKQYTLEIKDDGTINFSASTVAGAKQGLAEMKLSKKAVQLQKKNLAMKAKQVRQSYTQYTRRRGHMFRGGRTVGRIIRIFQSADRDAHARQLANAMAPLDREMNRLDRIILNLDNAMTQLGYKLQTMA